MKRVFDFLFSSVCLLCSAPLWILIPLAIRLEDGGPVFFRQTRVGKDRRPFEVLKFRSMVPDAETGGAAVMASANDPRITRTGLLLRKTAMDELPQLLNIWKGEMSFVGPRALRESERVKGKGKTGEALLKMADISGFDLRQSVAPGLTGMAQVYAPRDLPHRQKFRYDLLYIRRKNFCLDLKLVLLSFWNTFTARWQV
ncbi:MAG TPA: sugar transferase [Nitrospiria bacterium]|nr:sugar transferase [Nitrospiria bacterium]